MNFINKLKSSIQDFDFKAAGQTAIDTAKTAGDVLAEKGKEIKTHYQDLKAYNKSKPQEVKAERMPEKDIECECLAFTEGSGMTCEIWMKTHPNSDHIVCQNCK